MSGYSEFSDFMIGAKYHQEKYNGRGYPFGLSGEEIPEIARIIGVADAYDAMTSNRSYRKTLPQEVVRGEIAYLSQKFRLQRRAQGIDNVMPLKNFHSLNERRVEQYFQSVHSQRPRLLRGKNMNPAGLRKM